MTDITLDKPRSRLLGALTIAAAQRLGGETFMVEKDNGIRNLRMARVGDIVLLDHPADTTGPRCIDCYLVEVQDFAAVALGGEGKKFKLDPQRLLYSLQWLHKGTPPDFHLQLARDPQLWFDFVATMLLGELSRHEPTLRDRLRAAQPTENGKDGSSAGPHLP